MDVREKLVELQSIITCPNAICNFCEYFKNKSACEKHKKEVIADNMITNGVTVQEWIPVTERLPEPGERVLATDGGFVCELYVNSRGQWQRYNVNDYSLLMALDILWWMPLPEPPKVDEEKKKNDRN